MKRNFSSRSTCGRPTNRRLHVEPLEDRRLLAAMPQLVKDINTTSAVVSSEPQEITEVGGLVFFRASTPTTGNELWKSDGTEASTVRVKDVNTGNYASGPRYLTNVNGTLYFTANDGIVGEELWTSDGTGRERSWRLISSQARVAATRSG